MFTGLIEKTGIVETLTVSEASPAGICSLRISTGVYKARPGDSIAVNGCCLTVTHQDRNSKEFQLSRETLERTNLGSLRSGQQVNLERALRSGDRLGGHLVSGHIDEAGKVLSTDHQGAGSLLSIGLSSEAAPLVIPKGSISLNGVSLTINTIEDQGAGVLIRMSIIPETLKRTNIGDLKVGDLVNAELDLTGKYILRAQSLNAGQSLRVLKQYLKT